MTQEPDLLSSATDVKKICKRAGIRPVIGLLKSDYRRARYGHEGILEDAIKTLSAAAAYNI